MFTKQAIQYVIWSRQRHNGFPIASRSVPVNFSLGLRSSLVRLSLVIRQSIEDLSRTERGTSKKRTKEQRISIEMPTRNYRQLDDLPPSWLAEHPSATTNQHTAIHHAPAGADSSTFGLTQAFSRRIKPFPPILYIPTHHKSPSQALKTHRRHTAQQPPKTRPTRLKHPLANT